MPARTEILPLPLRERVRVRDNMKNIAAIFEREFKSYFVSPAAYVVFVVFLLFTGFMFSGYLILASRFQSEANMQNTFMNMSITLLLMAPGITMRLLAEEKRTGTIELLMTSPVTDLEVVLGKFFASYAMLLVLFILTFIYPIFLKVYGNPDFGPILSGYLGIMLLGAFCLSFGIMISSMTKHQIVAFMITLVGLLLFWVIGMVATQIQGAFGKILSYLSVIDHLEDFARGVIAIKHVIYYLSLTVVWIFITIKSVESAKWR